MRRMYSEQELSRIIKVVFEEELEGGAFDESIADAVDAYLVEHPVDITALEGQDVSLKTLTSTGDISVGEDLAVVGTITGGEIVEIMSGYSASILTVENYTLEKVYVGAVKNGNKLTVVFALNITKTAADTGYHDLAVIAIPTAISNKLYPTSVGGSNVLSIKSISLFSSVSANPKIATCDLYKSGGIKLSIGSTSEMVVDTKYYLRYEETFLLSDDLVGE